MQRIRDRKHFYDEIKWGKVSAKKLDILKILVDVFFSAEASLTVFVTDKRKHDVISRFDGQFGAYEALARQLVHASIRRGETMFLIADEYSTPPGETFEEDVVLPPGSLFALADQGATLSIWVDAGAGYVKLASLSDAAWDGGYAGVATNSTGTRLRRFAAAALPIVSP